MSDKKKGTESVLKTTNGAKEKKAPSISRILFVAIILLLAFLMVGGTFFYIFSPGFRDSGNAFGFYDKKPIVLEGGNVFGRTLVSDPNYSSAVDGNNYTQMYQTFHNAYQAQVIFEALNKLAQDAKITAPKRIVDKVIVGTGAYNDEKGNFSTEVYNKTNPVERQSFYQYVESITPYQQVLDDIDSVLVPEAEEEYVRDVNRNTKDFEYLDVNYGVYPTEKAIEFITSNTHLFDKLNLAIISCVTEERAKEAYEALSTKSWKEVVEEYSEDSYKENNGEFGSAVFVNAIASNINDNSDVEKVRLLNPDTYSEPVQGPYSWAIYKMLSPVEDAKTTDSDTIYYAKSLIFTQTPDEVKPYIEVAKTSITSLITESTGTDLHAIADEYGLQVEHVVGSVYNAAGSQFMADISYVDMAGTMAGVINKDKDLYKKVYSAQDGEVFGPFDTDSGSAIFIKAEDGDPNVSLSSTMYDLYKEYSGAMSELDVRRAILESPKHKDNFMSKFIELFLGNNANRNSDSSSVSADSNTSGTENVVTIMGGSAE